MKIKFEWYVLWYISGYASMKSIRAYETTGFVKYVYLAQIALVIYLIALAKVDVFNIFKFIRKLPKNTKEIVNLFLSDYKYWRINGVRRKYD